MSFTFLYDGPFLRGEGELIKLYLRICIKYCTRCFKMNGTITVRITELTDAATMMKCPRTCTETLQVLPISVQCTHLS
jgi:hypothetical protein